MKNLDIIEGESLLERGSAMGTRLGDGLRSLAADGVLSDVRGDGAVWAVAHRSGIDCTSVRDAMLARGVITRAIGTDTNTFCPPFVTTDAQIDRIVDALAESVAAVEAH
ncbi:MAG: aminotransferase class III-fold pyridoxal phosphate-dependent enzyme [Ilumatobacteraceae bacterium]